MSRINTNVNSLISQRILSQQNGSLNTSLERLSTGLAINRGKDNPAGLIASENLRSEKAAISAAISNTERADQVMNIAEGGLQEINALLLEVQGLVGTSANDAGLSIEEKEANQLQVDSILQTIDRIAEATSFEGVKLLNGTFDFTISAQVTEVNSFKINAAKLSHNETRDVEVVVTASAQHAGLFLSTNGALDLTAATDTFTFEIAGSKGSREFSFASGTTLASIAEAINTFKQTTGVSASTSGNGVVVKSIEYGSNEFVSFDIVSQGGQAGAVVLLSAGNENDLSSTSTTFANVNNPIRDEGQDVGAIINGIAATSEGRTARIATDFLDMEIELDAATGSNSLQTISAFTITGGGAKFNLGPQVNITNQASIGIQNVASRKLGDGNVGFLNDLGSGNAANLVDGDLEVAQKIVNLAISSVSNLRGRIGAFQSNVIGATSRNLGVALENTSAAESSIRDTDFAAETAELTRSQILVNASTNVLGIANQQPNSVLSLLG
ncbi:MAG TPA: flagellin [Phycisphaerales bacterium]|nr:flagellin [Phycisphaerales bacterium]